MISIAHKTLVDRACTQHVGYGISLEQFIEHLTDEDDPSTLMKAGTLTVDGTVARVLSITFMNHQKAADFLIRSFMEGVHGMSIGADSDESVNDLRSLIHKEKEFEFLADYLEQLYPIATIEDVIRLAREHMSEPPSGKEGLVH